MSCSSDLPPSLNVLHYFRHIGDQVGARVAMMHSDLTPNEIALLLQLGSPKRMKDLAELLTCQPSNVTPLVGRCVEKGWMRKTRSSTDARSVLVELTSEGMAFRTELVAEIARLIEHATKLPPETFAQISDILHAHLK